MSVTDLLNFSKSMTQVFPLPLLAGNGAMPGFCHVFGKIDTQEVRI
jgi:hypothetical protein